MTDLKTKRYWVFDMDGTLTVAVHDFAAIRDALGLPQGRPILEQLAELPDDEAERLRERLDVIEKDLVDKASAQTGAPELLALLAERGAKMGILTRNSHENALLTLEVCGMSEYFDTDDVLGRESCEVKPSADGIHKLLDGWGANAGDAVMVGDFLFDLVAGREAGTTTVYLDTNGGFEYHDQADICVHDLGELARLITE